MSCNLRVKLMEALRAEAAGGIAKAKANVEVYLHAPVGIGEHPDIVSAVQEQLDVIAEHEERLAVLDKHFADHD